MNFDQALEQAEQRKAAGDAVRLAQAELAPVREWAVQAERDFLKGAAKLQPRLDQAVARLNRLTALLGAPPSVPFELWQQLDPIRQGIPASYRKIANDIDTLTPYLVGQHNYMEPLRQKRNCPPGNISHLVAALERVEKSLDEYAERFQEGGGGAPAGVIVPERPAGLQVESQFTPRIPRLGG